MTVRPAAPADWRPAAVEALRLAVAGWPGQLRPLADEAVRHLADRLQIGPPGAVGALAVPAAVFSGLRGGRPPAGLLVAAAATYLAWDLLDDDMDGDPPAFWRAHSGPERMLGAHLLIATAAGHAPREATLSVGPELGDLFLVMAATVIDGQLHAERPLDSLTTVDDVAAGVEARSGAMLAGFAEMAAVAADADSVARTAARRLGRELAVAWQLVNDLTELLSGRTSDLRNRTATMIGAFALQRARATSRIDLVESLRTAATDDNVRRRLIGGDLAPALADVRMLARLHLAAARSAAENLVRHSADRGAIDMLIDETNSVLDHCFSGAHHDR